MGHFVKICPSNSLGGLLSILPLSIEKCQILQDALRYAFEQ